MSIAPDSQEAWRDAVRDYDVPAGTALLSDPGNAVAEAYDVMRWQAATGEPGHTFMLVDERGEIAWVKDYGALDHGGIMYVAPEEITRAGFGAARRAKRGLIAAYPPASEASASRTARRVGDGRYRRPMNQVLVSGPRGLWLRCRVPVGRRERLRGSIGLESLPRHEAFLIANATSVHTFGMRFAILVVRLDAELRVVDVRRVSPWKLVPPVSRARHVLECHEEVDLRVGDELAPVPSRGDPGDRGSAAERADEAEDERGGHRQRRDDDRQEPPRPRRERDGLAAGASRLDDPEELQQRPHH